MTAGRGMGSLRAVIAPLPDASGRGLGVGLGFALRALRRNTPTATKSAGMGGQRATQRLARIRHMKRLSPSTPSKRSAPSFGFYLRGSSLNVCSPSLTPRGGGRGAGLGTRVVLRATDENETPRHVSSPSLPVAPRKPADDRTYFGPSPQFPTQLRKSSFFLSLHDLNIPVHVSSALALFLWGEPVARPDSFR